MKKIKICFVIDSLQIGGSEKLTLDVISNIDKTKFDITIITILKVESSKALVYDLHPEVKLIKIDTKNYNYIKRLQLLWAELKKFDIVHSCLQTSNLYCSMINFFKRFNYVVTIHGVDGVFFEDVFISYKYFFLTKHVQTFLFKFVNNFIAVSKQTQHFLVEKRRIAPEKINVIYHGIDLRNYPGLNRNEINKEIRIKYGFQEQDFIIAYIGRFATGKGLEELLENLQYLLHARKNLKLLMVGDGTENMKLREIVRRYNLEEKIIFTGFQTNVIPFFYATDLLVLPSFSEGIPISILEAMYYETLVLSSDVGGIPEVIENKKNGFLFKKGEFKIMIDNIIEIIDDKVKYNHVKQNAKITIANKFNLQLNVKSIESYFSKLISP